VLWASLVADAVVYSIFPRQRTWYAQVRAHVVRNAPRDTFEKNVSKRPHTKYLEHVAVRDQSPLAIEPLPLAVLGSEVRLSEDGDEHIHERQAEKKNVPNTKNTRMR